MYLIPSRPRLGETLIGLKIQELEESGASFEEIVTEVESYISSMNTFFVIETLETLRKAGRLSGLKSICGKYFKHQAGNGIHQRRNDSAAWSGKGGMKKALSKMVEDMLKVTKTARAVCACHFPLQLSGTCTVCEKKRLRKSQNSKKIVIVNTAGVSSMYANEGGVILSV